MNLFQRFAVAAFVCLELVIFMGAVVRASGSGLGCPDWPFCYGCWTPPASREQIDFAKLNLEKFRKAAAAVGRDPATITAESIKAEFDPVGTWVEYINRLSSIPLSLSVLGLLLVQRAIPAGRRAVGWAAWGAFGCLLANALLGAVVVLSGLHSKPITAHMALAILMLCVLVYAAWAGTDRPWLRELSDPLPRQIAWVLFFLVIVEGIMGSQVRELTDQLAATHAGHQRAEWVGELEMSLIYLVHRSFSWLILGTGIWFLTKARKALGRAGWLELGIMGLIFAQMLLGVVLARIGILQVAQVLHIGLSSFLVSGLYLWLLASRPEQVRPASVG